MAQSQLIPSRTYPAGTTPWGPFTLAAGSSRLKLTLTREGWPDSGGEEIISIEAVVSFDNGQTWSGVLGVNPSIQFGTAGGDLGLDKNGQPRTTSDMTTSITTPCRIKGIVTLQQQLSTSILIELS